MFGNFKKQLTSVRAVIKSSIANNTPEKVIADSKMVLKTLRGVESNLSGKADLQVFRAHNNKLEKLIQSYVQYQREENDEVKQLVKTSIVSKNLNNIHSKKSGLIKKINILLPQFQKNLEAFQAELPLISSARSILNELEIVELSFLKLHGLVFSTESDVTLQASLDEFVDDGNINSGFFEEQGLSGLREHKMVLAKFVQNYDEVQDQINIELEPLIDGIKRDKLEDLRLHSATAVQSIAKILPAVQKNLRELQEELAQRKQIPVTQQEEVSDQVIQECLQELEVCESKMKEIKVGVLQSKQEKDKVDLLLQKGGDSLYNAGEEEIASEDEAELYNMQELASVRLNKGGNQQLYEKFQGIKKKVTTVTDIMHANLDNVLGREEKYTDLAARADRLLEEVSHCEYLSRRVNTTAGLPWSKPAMFCIFGSVAMVCVSLLLSSGVVKEPGAAVSAIKIALLSVSAVLFASAMVIQGLAIVNTKIGGVKTNVIPPADIQY